MKRRSPLPANHRRCASKRVRKKGALQCPRCGRLYQRVFRHPGTVWRIIFILLLAWLPFVMMIIVMAVGGWLPEQGGERSAPAVIASAFASGFFQLVMGALLVAITSRLFQALANRVLQPAGGPRSLHP